MGNHTKKSVQRPLILHRWTQIICCAFPPHLKRGCVWHLLRMDVWCCCQTKSIYFLCIRSLFYFKSYMHTGWQQADFPNCSALSLLASGIRPSMQILCSEICSASFRVVPPSISPFWRSVMHLWLVVHYKLFFFFMRNKSVTVSRNKSMPSPSIMLYWETIWKQPTCVMGMGLVTGSQFLEFCEYFLIQVSY